MIYLVVFCLGLCASAYCNVFAVFWASVLPVFFLFFLEICETGGVHLPDLAVLGLVGLFQVGYFAGGMILLTGHNRHIVKAR